MKTKGTYELVAVYCGNSGFEVTTTKSTCPMCGKSIFNDDHSIGR